MAAPKEYYVYQLIDPRSNKPFYIGKGKGQRLDAHEKEAAKGAVHPKCEVIRDIQSAGLVVGKEIVKRFANEDAAYKYEARLIKRIGLENLTNLAHGGRIAFPVKPKDTELEKDKEWVSAVSVLAKKTNGVDSIRVWFGGVWHELKRDIWEGLGKRIGELGVKRGREWVVSEFEKHNVIIRSASKVENHAAA